MFESGVFARAEDEGGDGAKEKCEAQALSRLTPELLSISLQVDPKVNPMEGLEGRAGLLSRLGDVLSKDVDGYFQGPTEGIKGPEKRPGFLVGAYIQLRSDDSSVFLIRDPSPTILQTISRITRVQRRVLMELYRCKFQLSGKHLLKDLHPYGQQKDAQCLKER